MSFEIRLRQLQPNSEDLQSDDDTGSFLRNVVFQTPSLWGEEVGALGAEGDTNESCEWGLGKVKPIANQRAEEGVEHEKAG